MSEVRQGPLARHPLRAGGVKRLVGAYMVVVGTVALAVESVVYLVRNRGAVKR